MEKNKNVFQLPSSVILYTCTPRSTYYMYLLHMGPVHGDDGDDDPFLLALGTRVFYIYI